MNSFQISRKASLLILINWTAFVICFVWTSVLQGSLLWWWNLNWSSWLEDLRGLTQLNSLSSGTFWIVWLMSAILFTVLSWSRKSTIITSQEPNELIAKRHLIGSDEMMETHPELKEKLLRLHQSLDNI